MSEIGTISKLDIRCAMCAKKNDCDHKRMENCAYFITEIPIEAEIGEEIAQPLMQPLLREPMKEEIQREIEKTLYKNTIYSCFEFGA